MKKQLILILALLLAASFTLAAQRPKAAPAQPTAQETPAPPEGEPAPGGDSQFVDLVEGPLGSLMAETACKNIGGSCTSHSQCGFIGFCEGGQCVCECNYGARCGYIGAPGCGYAGFCNSNNRCACY